MKPVLLAIGAALGSLLPGATILVAQQPLLRIERVDTASVQVVLDREAYLLLIEYRPGARPRVILPSAEEVWSPTKSGVVTLEGPIRILKAGRVVKAPSPQCIVRMASVTSWTSTAGFRPVANQGACGPTPTIRAYEGGYGAWADWRTPHYGFPATLDPYLLVVAFDTDAPPFSLATLGTILNQTPVDVAQGIGGSLSPRPNDPAAWQAAIWVRR